MRVCAFVFFVFIFFFLFLERRRRRDFLPEKRSLMFYISIPRYACAVPWRHIRITLERTLFFILYIFFCFRHQSYIYLVFLRIANVSRFVVVGNAARDCVH